MVYCRNWAPNNWGFHPERCWVFLEYCWHSTSTIHPATNVLVSREWFSLVLSLVIVIVKLAWLSATYLFCYYYVFRHTTLISPSKQHIIYVKIMKFSSMLNKNIVIQRLSNQRHTYSHMILKVHWISLFIYMYRWRCIWKSKIIF